MLGNPSNEAESTACTRLELLLPEHHPRFHLPRLEGDLAEAVRREVLEISSA